MARRGKCKCDPPRRGPMTVPVRGYFRKNGTFVKPHKRHKPRV